MRSRLSDVDDSANHKQRIISRLIVIRVASFRPSGTGPSTKGEPRSALGNVGQLCATQPVVTILKLQKDVIKDGECQRVRTTRYSGERIELALRDS